MELPHFTDSGLLPPDDYELTFEELRESHLITGIGNPSRTWDRDWREHLLVNAEILVTQLWNVGIADIYVDGSFVENKDHLGDIDGYFVCDERYAMSGRLQTDLNRANPNQVWDWRPQSRQPHPSSIKRELPMWRVYRVEFYPHWDGLTSGIRDEHGNNLEFPAAFRKTRVDHAPKGIVKIVQAPG